MYTSPTTETIKSRLQMGKSWKNVDEIMYFLI